MKWLCSEVISNEIFVIRLEKELFPKESIYLSKASEVEGSKYLFLNYINYY